MAYFHFKNVRIAGISAGVPKRIVDNLNSEFQISKDYSNAEYVETTGVRERRMDEGHTTSDLCFKAANQLISDINWERDSIDAILMLSQTLDFIKPATACILQYKLGLNKECYAEDIQLGCSGWVYGLSNAASLLQNGNIKRVLLCVGDARNNVKFEDMDEPLFGYAGAVTALEYDEGNEGLYCHYGTDGSGFDSIITPNGGCRNQFDEHSLEYRMVDGKWQHGLRSKMNGMDVFAFGISVVPKSIKGLASHFGFDYLESDYFLFHQANKKMNNQINKKLKLPQEKVPMCMELFGNTSSASIPLTIVTELKGPSVLNDTKFMCCGFGVGLSWGTVAFTAKNMYISKLVEVDTDEHLL